MKRLLTLIALAAAQTAAILLLPAQEPQEPEKPQAPVEMPDDKWCLDCHADLAEGPAVHEPVTEEMCEACHVQDDETLHAFTMDQDQTATCLTCHDAATGEHAHQPVAEGSCTACHEPHHAADKSLLRFADEEEMCMSCHAEDGPDFDLEHVHGPVDAGMCTLCHLPHASDEPGLLLDEPVTLCLSCHEDLERGLDEAENIHLPVDEDCGMCHDPHSSEHQGILNLPGATLCFDCHADVKEKTTAAFDHGAVSDDKECLNCHAPHHSSFPALLETSPDALCMSCHTEAVEGNEGRIVQGMGALMQLEFKHGPVAEGDCSACHDPHGAENMAILKDPYPERFYAGWNPELYKLCFECHEQSAFEDAQTASLTGFRDGEENLHFLHVSRDTKGRTCRACHEVHASGLPSHLAEKVPFGRWMMPINFEPTESGGSCAPGCHASESYDRAMRPPAELEGQ